MVGLALGLVAAVVYGASARPDLVGGDAGEFQFVPWVLGIAHHTGYPLYTLLGWAWAHLPLGSIARRMNLLSAVFGAISVGLTAALAARLAGGGPIGIAAGAVGGLALLVAPLHWHWATIAGVRAPAVAEIGWLLVATVGALAALTRVRPWRQRATVAEVGPESDRSSLVSPRPTPDSTRQGELAGHAESARPDAIGGALQRARRAFALVGLAAGVALAHHRAGALALPPIALALATTRVWWLGWRAWLAALGLFALPLLSYAYLPLRGAQHPPFHQWHPETWPGFLDLVLAVEHSQVHFAFPLAAMPARAAMLLGHLRGEFGQLGLGLAAVGGLWLLLRWPRAFVVLMLFAAIQSWQVLNWDVGPDQLNVVYELPAHLVLAASIGLAVAAAAEPVGWLAGRIGRPGWSAAAGGGVAGAAALVLTLWLGQRGVGQWQAQATAAIRPVNHDRAVLADGWIARRIVAGGTARVEPNAVLVGDWEQATIVWYRQLVEGIGPDMQVYYPVENLGAAIEDFPTRPIWLMARTAVPADRRLSGDGPFVRVGPPDRWATAPPSNTVAVEARFDDQLALVAVGYADRLGARVLAVDPGGDVLPLTLYWRALGPSRKDLSVSVRLIDGSGRVAAQQDNGAPVLSLYPTSRWRDGEVVGDYYELPYRSLAPGQYRLEVRVYLVENGGFRDLRVGGTDHAELPPVRR